MSLTKLQLVCASAVIATGVGSYVAQNQTQAALRAELSELRQQQHASEIVSGQNRQLACAAAEITDLQKDDIELTRLREESAVLLVQAQTRARATAQAAASSAPASGLQGAVFPPDQVDRIPTAKFQSPPRYPSELRKAGITGSATVAFVVDAQGQVHEAHAIKSSLREFEAVAVDAVSKWQFEPGQKSGLKVNTQLIVPIVFSLEKNEPTKLSEWF